MTYELLISLSNQLTVLNAKFETFSQTIALHAKSDSDHEVRIRSLESRLTTLETSSTTSRGNWKEVWYVGLAAGTLLVTIASTLVVLFVKH